MAKEYKDASPAEKYKSAMDKEKADKSYSVKDALINVLAPKEPVPPTPPAGLPSKKAGGKVGCSCQKMAKGGTASSRADGCATRGKTKGRMV